MIPEMNGSIQRVSGPPRPEAAPAPAPRPAEPADRVSLGSPPGAEHLQRPAGNAGISARASTRELYFGSNRGMKMKFTLKPPNQHFTKGFWTLEHINWSGAGTSFLDLGCKPGEIAQPDREGSEPLGRLIRTTDGWLGESVKESNLPYTRISRSKLCTFLGDDGTIQMTLTELFREGGGAIYRLDADAYLRDRNCTPPVQRTYVFGPEEENPTPPFPFHQSEKKRELSSLDQFAGEWATQASMARMAPSEKAPSGGWKVHLKRPWRVENDIMLSDQMKVDSEQDRGPYEKALFDRWKRVPGGWQTVDRAPATPENFDRVNEARLRTLLTDEGAVFMTLYEEYMDGRKCAFILDSSDYLGDPGKPPSVLASQYYSANNPLDEKALLAEAAKKKLNIGQSPSKGDGTVEEEENWLVIDGLKLNVQQGS
jgi:hypothetical protein